MNLVKSYNNIAEKLHITCVVRAVQAIALLAARLKIAEVFFKSGLTKIKTWDSTLLLFEYEYEVPLLSSKIAAILSTFNELVFPVFLALGLFSRITVLPLLAMTLVIEFFIIANAGHYYWMFLMVFIVAFGSGELSLDKLIAKKTKLKQI